MQPVGPMWPCAMIYNIGQMCMQNKDKIVFIHRIIIHILMDNCKTAGTLGHPFKRYRNFEKTWKLV